MDRRKILREQQNSLYEALNSEELNLELANNIENLLNLKDIILTGAYQSYHETAEKRKILTPFSHQENLDDWPKSVVVIGLVGWYLLYRRGAATKLSLIWMFMGFSIYSNLKRHFFCTSQTEYADFKKLNASYHRIISIKKRTNGFELFLRKFFSVDLRKPIPQNFLQIPFEKL